MLTVEQALEQILSHCHPPSTTETLPLLQARGRVLAETVTAPRAVPPADNSAMDGYALHTDSLSQQHLPISQRIAAGQTPEPLQPGTAARIFTGAEIPPGANTVVMQENCAVKEDQLHILSPVAPQQNIRPRGNDIALGTQVLIAGQRLGAAQLGLLASLGIAEVSVYQPLRVGILSSGNELAEPGETIHAGQIYNSNRTTLTALIKGLGMEAVDLGRVADNLAATEIALQEGAASTDVLLTTGGVSVGEEDHIKQAVENLGQLQLWKLAIKPGKPLAFGAIGNKPFFGLPGNPVSAFVTFLVVCQPFLLKAQGHSHYQPHTLRLPAGFTMAANHSRQEYRRVQICDGQLLEYPNQSSGALSSVSWAHGLAIVPVNTPVAPGDPLTVIPFNDIGVDYG